MAEIEVDTTVGVVSIISEVLPHLLSAAVNWFVWIGFKRSSLLRKEYRIVLRDELVFNMAFASTLALVLYRAWLKDLYYFGEVYFYIASFLMSFGGNVITASLTLAAISRYLSARRPQGRFAAALLKMDNINFVLWPVLIVYTLPEVFMMNVRESDGALLLQMDKWQLFATLIDGVLHLAAAITYYVHLRLLTGTFNLENAEPIPGLTNVHLLQQGNNRIRRCVQAYFCLFMTLLLVMIGLFFLAVHWIELIGHLTLGCEILWLLLCPAESICFGLLDKTFRTECSPCSSNTSKGYAPSKPVDGNTEDAVPVALT